MASSHPPPISAHCVPYRATGTTSRCMLKTIEVQVLIGGDDATADLETKLKEPTKRLEMIKYNTKKVCHRITHSQPIICGSDGRGSISCVTSDSSNPKPNLLVGEGERTRETAATPRERAMYYSSARGRERGGHRLFLRFPACAAPPSLFFGDPADCNDNRSHPGDANRYLGISSISVVEQKKKLDDESEKKKQLEQAQVSNLCYSGAYWEFGIIIFDSLMFLLIQKMKAIEEETQIQETIILIQVSNLCYSGAYWESDLIQSDYFDSKMNPTSSASPHCHWRDLNGASIAVICSSWMNYDDDEDEGFKKK
ncbi:hypothetical protein LXL04_022814 [Taraxacum kok-saghyz]